MLYDGTVVEEGSSRQILLDPLHPYTRTLTASRSLTAGTTRHNRFFALEYKGLREGTGRCPFITLCPNKKKLCGEESPNLVSLSDDRKVRCFVVEGRDG